MSFTQLKDYIQTLTASGLLEQSGMEFKTTPKGFEFLKAYESVNTLMERVESFPDSSNRAGAQPMEMPAISR